MSARFIVKFVLGLVLVILLVVLCYGMSDWLIGVLGNAVNDDAAINDPSGDYQIYTPEPAPTMPEYMMEDSFYDNAGSVDFEGE